MPRNSHSYFIKHNARFDRKENYDENDDESSEEHDSSGIFFKTLDSTFSNQRQLMSWYYLSSEVRGDILFRLRSERRKLIMGNM